MHNLQHVWDALSRPQCVLQCVLAGAQAIWEAKDWWCMWGGVPRGEDVWPLGATGAITNSCKDYRDVGERKKKKDRKAQSKKRGWFCRYDRIKKKKKEEKNKRSAEFVVLFFCLFFFFLVLILVVYYSSSAFQENVCGCHLYFMSSHPNKTVSTFGALSLLAFFLDGACIVLSHNPTIILFGLFPMLLW